MNSPNMASEVIEAVHLMYEDYPDVEVDCYLYLSNLYSSQLLSSDLNNKVVFKLQEMGRCPECGSLMQIHHYKEPHPELDGCPMEDMTEVSCPNCDIRGGEDY